MEIASVIKKGPTNDRILKTYNRFTVFDNLLYAKIALFHSLVRSRNVNMHIQLAAHLNKGSCLFGFCNRIKYGFFRLYLNNVCD